MARQAAKSPAYVHRRLQLLNLHPEARAALADGDIAIGHADRLTRVEVEMQPKALASCRSEIVGGRAAGGCAGVRRTRQGVEADAGDARSPRAHG